MAALSSPTVDHSLKTFFFEYGTVRYRASPSSDTQILDIPFKEHTPPSFLSSLFSSFIEFALPQPSNPAHPKRVYVDVSKIPDFQKHKRSHPAADNLDILKCCDIPPILFKPALHHPIASDYIELQAPETPSGACVEIDDFVWVAPPATAKEIDSASRRCVKPPEVPVS